MTNMDAFYQHGHPKRYFKSKMKKPSFTNKERQYLDGPKTENSLDRMFGKQSRFKGSWTVRYPWKFY